MTTQKFRTEHDSIGPVDIPADALWGAQTQRAIDNFPISGMPLPAKFIRALAQVKAGLAEGQPLDLLLKDARVWGQRQSLFKRAVQRIGLKQSCLALSHAARIDAMIKGAAGAGDVWDEFLQLGLAVSAADRAG